MRKVFAPLVLPVPALIFLGFLFMAMFIILRFSFDYWSPSTGQVSGFTIQNYLRSGSGIYLKSIVLTFQVAGLVTVITLVLSYPLAFSIARLQSRVMREVLLISTLLPLFTNVVSLSYGWLVLLAPSGVVNRLLQDVHLIDKPLNLLFNLQSVTLGLIHTSIPFMVLPLSNVIRKIDPALEDVSKSLGASPFRTFISVTLPLSLPGVLAGSLLVFAISISAFSIPVLLGGNIVYMMTLAIRDQMTTILNWPFGSALSIILVFISLVLIGGYRRLLAPRTKASRS